MDNFPLATILAGYNAGFRTGIIRSVCHPHLAYRVTDDPVGLRHCQGARLLEQ